MIIVRCPVRKVTAPGNASGFTAAIATIEAHRLYRGTEPMHRRSRRWAPCRGFDGGLGVIQQMLAMCATNIGHEVTVSGGDADGAIRSRASRNRSRLPLRNSQRAEGSRFPRSFASNSSIHPPNLPICSFQS